MRVYQVDRYAGAWGVYDSYGVFVSGPWQVRDEALTRCDALNAEARRRATEQARPCMCCGCTFTSAGIENRLCAGCRDASRQMVG